MWIILTVLFLSFIFWIRKDNEIDKKPRKKINWDKLSWTKQLEIEILGQRYSYINMQKKILKDLEI